MTIFSSKNLKTAKRRGISEIIGSLLMLAIVAAFGSIILLQGMQGVTNFNSIVSSFDQGLAKSVQESLTVEQVNFNSTNTNKNVTMWVRNTGTSDVTIDRITMVKLDTQHLIINKDVLTNPALTIFAQDVKKISITDSDVTLPSGTSPSTWSGTLSGALLQSSKYRISITTSTGNSFESVAQPFNT